MRRLQQTRVNDSINVRIAFVIINCNRWEGTAKAVVEVAERMAQGYGHEVHLFSRTAEDVDTSRVIWHRVPGPRRPEVANFVTFYATVSRMISMSTFDIVHSAGCNTASANVYTIQNIQRAKRKVLKGFVREERISRVRRLTRWLHLVITSVAEKRVYESATGRKAPLLLPVSRGTERELREHYDIGNSTVKIIPNAADLVVFHPIAADIRAAWRKANGLIGSDFVCIFSGGEWARKGLDLAIRALALVPHLGLKLFVAGDDPDRARYFRLARNLGQGERVIFGGFRKDIATAFGASDLFLFPSRYEAFSLAMIEAAACGLPSVVAKINGTEDFINPGTTGEFVKHEADNIAAVLERLVSSDRCKLVEMGQAARQLVMTHYTWDRVATATEQCYQEYLNGRS